MENKTAVRVERKGGQETQPICGKRYLLLGRPDGKPRHQHEGRQENHGDTRGHILLAGLREVAHDECQLNKYVL